MTKQQMHRLQSVTTRLANNNCSIMPSMVIMERLEEYSDKKLFVSLTAETENGTFKRYLNASIGPRGALHIYSESQY